MKKYWSELFLGISTVILAGFGAFLYLNGNNGPQSTDIPVEKKQQEITLKYGYDVKTHHFESVPIKYGSFIGDILSSYDISYNKILKLEKEAEKVFSLKKIKAGKDITFVRSYECESPTGFIYSPNLFTYIDFTFGDSISVVQKDVPFETCREIATGEIRKGSSLSEAMSEKGLSIALVDELEDALAQVYFPSAQPGDQFKIIFDRKYIDGKPVGSGNILSASYKSGNSEYFGFYFENDRYKGFYDADGTPNKKTFLRAPVRASRISSFYNPNRFHPVLKRRKAHLGTDYAAPKGTPIFSVANGVITKRAYTKNNGNYIKIKHNGTYQSQYLHMSKFKSGLRVGSRVKQGEVIGYVGKTGLATGNHVCFRFWKNGKQINHLRENFPPLDPMPKESLPEFYEVRDVLWRELNSFNYDNETSLAFASIHNQVQAP